MNNYIEYNNNFYNINSNGGYPYGYPSGILTPNDLYVEATLAAAAGTVQTINMDNYYMQQNQNPYNNYNIPNSINSAYSPFINVNNQNNYTTLYDANGVGKRVYTGPSYYDPETMQTIKNDMPLKAGPNSPLEALREGTNFTPYTPGSKGYIEAEKSDGTVDKLAYPIVKNDEATITKPGGFNPVTGLYTPPEVVDKNARDCKPIVQMINEAVYGKSKPIQVKPPAEMTVLGPNVPQNPQMQHFFGVNQYTNPYNNQMIYNRPLMNNISPYGYGYMTPMYGNGYANGYPTNEFNAYMINEILYSENPSCFDVNEMLEGIFLTDEEREKINHNRGNIYETNYYNNYLMNSYAANRARQEMVEKARTSYINHFTNLSKIAHAYDGSKFDEAKIKERFDPMANINNKPGIIQNAFINPITSTKEQIEQRNFEEIKMKCMYADTIADQYINQSSMFNMQKAAAKANIKASHDALIGVKPGEHYTLAQYLDNAYKIGINNEMKKVRDASKNGKLRYNSNNVKQTLIQKGVMKPDQNKYVSSKDEEFFTIESAIKSIYDMNKANIPFTKPDHPQSLMIELGDSSSNKKPKVTAVNNPQYHDIIQNLDPKEDVDLMNNPHFLASKERWNESMKIDAIRRGATY